MIELIFNLIVDFIEGLRNLINILGSAMSVFANWGAFVPSFVSAFITIAVSLSIILVILNRANK